MKNFIIVGLLQLLVLVTLSSCKVESPIDLKSKLLNQNSFPYTQTDIVIFKNTSSLNTAPLLDDPTSFSYSINPQLPTGLNINPLTGQVTGTPLVQSGKSIYTVTASNSVHTVYSSLTIEVKDVPIGSITYAVDVVFPFGSPDNMSMLTGFTLSDQEVFQDIMPVTTGGAVTSYSVNNNNLALVGLSLDPGTGRIIAPSGKIEGFFSSTVSVTITATNSGGSASTTLFLNITLAKPNVSYASPSYTSPTMTPIVITTDAFFTTGASVIYSITPTLPLGLTFSTTTATIAGTPLKGILTTLYEVTATNSGGNHKTNFNLTITDTNPATAGFKYEDIFLNLISENLPVGPDTAGNQLLQKDSSIIYWIPTLGVGLANKYTSSPPLPPGLTLNVDTGVISGTPTTVINNGAPGTPIKYEVFAENTAGQTSVEIYIEVDLAPPSNFTFTQNPPANFTINTQIASNTPIVSGSQPMTYDIDVPIVGVTVGLPPGLSISENTGVISGTPLSPFNDTGIALPTRIIAMNSAGSVTTDIIMKVVDEQITQFIYTTMNPSYKCGSTIQTNLPNYEGGEPSSYNLPFSVSLPTGIDLNLTNGYITGIPTVAGPPTSYNVNAENSATGGINASLDITILPIQPNYLYTSTELFTDIASVISPTITNASCHYGEIYSIQPALASGISFDPLTGVINSLTSNIVIRKKYVVNVKNATTAIETIDEQQDGIDGVDKDLTFSVSYKPSADFEIVQTEMINYNDDEYTDLLILEKKCPLLCTAATIKIFTGSLNGEFIPAITIDLSSIENAPIYFDIDMIKPLYFNDGDYNTDLVYIEKFSNTVHFLQSKKNDSTSARTFSYYGKSDAPNNVTDIEVMDVEQDGIPEILLSNNSYNMSIYKFDGNHYTHRTIKTFYQIPGTPGVSQVLGISSVSQFEILDIDADGTLDIVILDSQNKRICNVIGTGDLAAFEDSCNNVIELPKIPVSMIAADYNLDEGVDLFVQLSDGNVHVYDNNGAYFVSEPEEPEPIFDPETGEEIEQPELPENVPTLSYTVKATDYGVIGGLKAIDTNNDGLVDFQVLDATNKRILNYKVSTASEGAIRFDIPQIIDYPDVSKFNVGPATFNQCPYFYVVACNSTTNSCGIPSHILIQDGVDTNCDDGGEEDDEEW
jgi:hypothetical protein